MVHQERFSLEHRHAHAIDLREDVVDEIRLQVHVQCPVKPVVRRRMCLAIQRAKLGGVIVRSGCAMNCRFASSV